MKFIEIGIIDWEKIYDFGDMDVLIIFWENLDGMIMIGGYVKIEIVGKKCMDKKGVNDYIVLKIDEEGEEKWWSIIGGSGEDIFKKVIVICDGGYVMVGILNSKVFRDKNLYKGLCDFWVVKIGDKEKDDEEYYNGLEVFLNFIEVFINIIVNYEFEKGMVIIYDFIGK